ncbi:MAG: hypothetical protein ABFD57_09625, partial [Smithella sp.]
CYDFRRISLKEIAANLQKVAEAEEIQISEAALSWIAEAGDGSMRDAQSIFDQVISYAGLNISDADVEDILGLVDRRYLLRLSESVLQRDAGACLIILEEAYLAGLDMRQLYQMMLKHFRNMLLVKIAGDGSSSFDINAEQIEALKKQVNNAARETLQRYLQILIGEEDSFRRSQETRLKLETIIVRMAYLEPVIPLGEIISTIEIIEQKLQQGLIGGENSREQELHEPPSIKMPAAAVRTIPEEDDIAASVDVPGKQLTEERQATNPAELSDNFKNFIKKENPILGAKIASAETIDFGDGSCTLVFPKGYIFLEDIRGKEQQEQLKQMAKEFCRRDVTLKITTINVDKTGINVDNGRGKANNINDIKREAMNHPLLQKVLDEFAGAEIVDIKTRTEKKQEV